MNKNSLTQDKEDDFGNLPAQINIPTLGVGTLRASGSWIAIMLMAEDERQRADIIVEVMKTLNITISDLDEAWFDSMCPKCGMSMRKHKSNYGNCF